LLEIGVLLLIKFTFWVVRFDADDFTEIWVLIATKVGL
jgi:hypothetical protein